jgi:serine/threonine-protein kinase
VFDIGDAGGRPFLSMEFIDGEDLASLLRRIGHLPKDKAIELAREICAGVAAAHELGVIHRDLKPANVMIDGRGRARVADFGLASAASELEQGHDAMAGTPAYMAPEQLQGADATVQSDIYSLGLVLYELFTGRRAHDADTIAALKEMHSSSTPPTSPSELVEDMDPAVERTIMQCVAPDPEERPPSALAVMAALPGGDPLAAMLKAGEMPSPELVAASGRRGTLTPKRALQLGAIVVLCTAVGAWVRGVPSIDDSLGGILAPEVLVHQAEVVLAELGLAVDTVDRAWGFEIEGAVVDQLVGASDAHRAAILRSDERPPLRFWYRASSLPMDPWNVSLPGPYAGHVVTPTDPPLTEAGMALVQLGPRGNLIEVRSVPRGVSEQGDFHQGDFLSVVVAAAGLDPSEIERIEWSGTSPMPGDPTVAWRVGSDESESGVRAIVMTFAGGRPTWVKVGEIPATFDVSPPFLRQSQLGIFFVLSFIVGAIVAWLNIRTGRWDRRGAARLAVFAFAICFTGEAIGSHHWASLEAAARGFFASVAYGATRALMAWLLYIAIEPFIRRLHPSSLVSWSRLLAGRVSDPSVGRDVLLGVTAFAVQTCLVSIAMLALGLNEVAELSSVLGGDKSPFAVTPYMGGVVRLPAVAVGTALGFLLIYVVARWMLGRLAAGAPALLWISAFFFYGAASATGLGTLGRITFTVIYATAATYLAVRHGLLAFVTYLFLTLVSWQTVLTLDPHDWYFLQTAVLLLLIIVLTIFGIRIATDRSFLPARS